MIVMSCLGQRGLRSLTVLVCKACRCPSTPKPRRNVKAQQDTRNAFQKPSTPRIELYCTNPCPPIASPVLHGFHNGETRSDVERGSHLTQSEHRGIIRQGIWEKEKAGNFLRVGGIT